MSTRCNIIIKDGFGDKLTFYRHSDGYPRGALPTLRKFMQWVKEGKIRDNVGQASGWLILIGAEEYGLEYIGGGERRQKTSLTEPSAVNEFSRWQCGSYEPTTDIHGDIEYLYTLDLKKKNILVQCVDFYDRNGNERKKPKFTTLKTITVFNSDAEDNFDSEILEGKPEEKEPNKPSRFEGIEVR